MKMADGGFRPAYNVQLATTCEEQIIVGMDVVNIGSDMAQLAPMVSQVEQRLECNVGDVAEGNSLLHGQEVQVFGDAGYQGADKRDDAPKDVPWHVAMGPAKRKALDKEHSAVDALPSSTPNALST